MTSEELAKQIRTLRDMNLTIVEFFEKEARQPLADAINESAAHGHVQALRGLRETFKVMANSAIENLTEEDRGTLDQRLREKFGRGLREESERDIKLVEAVLRRGAIRQDREYRTIDRYVDKLVQQGGDATLIKKLQVRPS